jgi:heptosyltransferase-2
MQHCPYVNQVLVYQRVRGDGGRTELRRRWRLIVFALRELWPRRFDLAISPRRDVDQQDAAMLCYLSAAPRRIGFTEGASELKRDQNPGFDTFFTQVLPAPDTHEVQSNLSVLRHLGFTPRNDKLELWSSREDEEWAQRVMADHQPGERAIALCVGASYTEKQWPVDRFIAVARELLKSPGTRVVIVGGPGEASAEAVQNALGGRSINLAGRATLLQTFAILRRCQLYVGNDTGPMHLAVAAGVPVVEVCMFPRSLGDWNRNSPLRFGPWGVANIVLQPDHPQPPCTDVCVAGKVHCILAVETADVLQAAVRLGEGTMSGNALRVAVAD